MVTKEAIDSALNAHSQWKNRLLKAIEEGKSEFQVINVQKDNLCEFGKWIYSLPENVKSSNEFINVRNLHAEFHKCAASVLDLAVNGKKEDALNKLKYDGEYNKHTGKLILALTNWKRKI